MKQATIFIDRHFQVGHVDPRIYGSFIEHLGRAVYGGIYQPGNASADADGLREDVIDLVKELNVPLVRYPGGNFVSGYDWEDGVGPKATRPTRLDLAWQVKETNQFGLNEFMQWAKKAHTQPMMAVNLGTRGVAAAKNLLEYCNMSGGSQYSDLRRQHGVDEPYGIKLWCLGNEMDGAWQIGHKTAYEYGRLAAETSRVMKMMDPAIETVACGSSSWQSPTFGSWEETVLDESYDTVDYLSLHQYFGGAGDAKAPRDFLAHTLEMDQFITEVVALADAVKARKHEQKRINLSFDEWNVWFHSVEHDKTIKPWSVHPHQLEDVYTLEDALLVAGMLITLLRHADRVKVACLAQLVNVIAPIMTSDKGAWRQTIFYPFAAMSRYGRGEVLNTQIKVPTYESTSGDAPYLDAVMIDHPEAGELVLFAVNKDLEAPMQVTVDVRQFEGYQVVKNSVLTGDDLFAVNTEAAPANVALQAATGAAVDHGLLTATLPKQSFTTLVLKKPADQ